MQTVTGDFQQPERVKNNQHSWLDGQEYMFLRRTWQHFSLTKQIQVGVTKKQNGSINNHQNQFELDDRIDKLNKVVAMIRDRIRITIKQQILEQQNQSQQRFGSLQTYSLTSFSDPLMAKIKQQSQRTLMSLAQKQTQTNTLHQQIQQLKTKNQHLIQLLSQCKKRLKVTQKRLLEVSKKDLERDTAIFILKNQLEVCRLGIERKSIRCEELEEKLGEQRVSLNREFQMNSKGDIGWLKELSKDHNCISRAQSDLKTYYQNSSARVSFSTIGNRSSVDDQQNQPRRKFSHLNSQYGRYCKQHRQNSVIRSSQKSSVSSLPRFQRTTRQQFDQQRAIKRRTSQSFEQLTISKCKS